MRPWIVPAVLSCACVSPDALPPERMGTAWGGGEVTVAFALDWGDGLEGAFTVPGSSVDRLRRDPDGATGLHVYPWTEEDPRDWDLNIEPRAGTDMSDLTYDFRCVSDLEVLRLLFTLNQESADSWMLLAPPEGETWPGSVIEDTRGVLPARLDGQGSFTLEVSWMGRWYDAPCDEYVAPDGIGAGTVTVTWAFTDSFAPEDRLWY
jgi:hypothetical protein